jgi:hypothetical protein
MKRTLKQAFFAGVLVLLVIGFLQAALGLLASPRVERLLASPGRTPERARTQGRCRTGGDRPIAVGA